MRTTSLLALLFIMGCGTASAPRPAVSALTVDPTAAVLLVGESVQLHARALDASGNPLTDRTVVYQSANPLVATVSDAGLVTARGAGQANISATCEGQIANAAIDSKLGAVVGAPGGVVSVLNGAVQLNIPAGALAADTRIYADPVDGLPAGPGLFVAGTGYSFEPANLLFLKQASLTLRYGTGVLPPDLSSSVALYSLDGASWDAVNGSVVDPAIPAVTAPVGGTGTFGLRAPGPVASLAVVPAHILVVLGTTQPLSAEPRDEGGSLLQNRSIAWFSADTLTAKVNQQGVVSGEGIGITRVSASSGGAVGSSTILVTILCSCPAPAAGKVQIGSAARTACACATPSPTLVRRRLP